jgi:hypothetical protein
MKSTDALRAMVEQAVEELLYSMATRAPGLYRVFTNLLDSRVPTAASADYFLDPDRFPFLHLPLWVLGEEWSNKGNLSFLEAVTESSVPGYYAIRLVDDLMDEPERFGQEALPVIHMLELRFVRPYHRLFPDSDDLWDFLEDTWISGADIAALDSELHEVDESAFRRICSKKVAAARIPTFAACVHSGRKDMIGPWLHFVDALGTLEQFLDDFYDWHRDFRAGRVTYILSEARRHTPDPDEIPAWIFGPGIQWARERLSGYLDELRLTAAALGSEEASRHVEARADRVGRGIREVSEGASAMMDLRRAFGELAGRSGQEDH